MSTLINIFKKLNIPLSSKKTVGPITCLEYLGIILDTTLMEARLPQEKVDRLIMLIEVFLTKSSVRKRDLLQLLGHFNFAARIILPGRTFSAYMFRLSSTVSKLFYFIKLTKECKNDLRMWLKFLQNWNKSSFFYDSGISSAPSLELFTDASSKCGFGGYYRGSWFCSEWPTQIPILMDHKTSMTFLELYPIVVAAVLWGHTWGKKRILFHCDNEAVVHVINKGTSKNNNIMKLMRTLIWQSAVHNFHVTSIHIPGKNNIISDSLSRFQLQKFRQAAPNAAPHPTLVPAMEKILWTG